MKGLIFSIKRYSVHDGPGIRVTFFMKGCPLSCIWCHNPEGISTLPAVVIKKNKVGSLEFDQQEEVGKFYSVKEILDIIHKEKVFINESKGGVTFSGGEPMLQSEFLKEVLAACKQKGYHTAVDTSGYSSSESFKSIIPYTDLFLFDLKHLDPVKHQELTGVTNEMILENLNLLLACGKDLMIRIPVIPGKNDDNDNLERLIQFLDKSKTESLKRISLLPYHKIGSSKYKRFSIPYRMTDTEKPSEERMYQLKEMFSETGIKVKIGG
jgi:pyruvate formate lyase activating enzyme